MELFTSLGNDIVDLSYSPSKHQDTRFMKRVFTCEEENTILSSIEKTKVLWAIWAAKEAAFKACQKKFPELVFSHRQFVVRERSLTDLKNCDKLQNLIGILDYQDLQLAIKWEWQNNFVHCLSVLTDQKKLFHTWEEIQYTLSPIDLNPDDLKMAFLKKQFSQRELDSIYSNESLQTRFYAKQFLHSLGLDQRIEITRPLMLIKGQKRKNPPILSIAGNICTRDEISLSHDGGWSAIAFRTSCLYSPPY